MSRTLTLRSLDIPSIHKFGIGFDGMLDELMRITEHQSANYPVYNIVKVSENDFYIEVAVAGFSEGDVKIEVDNRILTISGSKLAALETIEYLHKGISDRSFVREFTLAEHVEVAGARMRDGILEVSLKREVPQKNAPKTIDIIYNK
jgi:molecular chaperone IbpA